MSQGGFLRRTVVFIFSVALICAFGAEGLCREQILVGSFTAVKGKVELLRGGEENWGRAEKDMPVYPGDKVKTGSKAEAELILDDGSMLRIEEKTQIEIIDSKTEEGKGEDGRKNILLNLGAGKILNNFKKLINKESRVSVATSAAIAGIRGTEFSVEAVENKTEVAVFEGEVEVSSPASFEKDAGADLPADEAGVAPQSVKVTQDQQTFVEKGSAPHTPQELTEKMRKYRESVVAKFHERVERNREKLDDIRKRREAKIEGMKKKVSDMQERNQEKIEGLKDRQKEDIKTIK